MSIVGSAWEALIEIWSFEQQYKMSLSNSQKQIRYITDKLKDGQIMLLMEDINLFIKSNFQLSKLVITSTSLYMMQGMGIKKYFKIQQILGAVVTPFSNQLVLFMSKDDSEQQIIRLASSANVRIVQHIITVREKFLEIGEKFMISVSSSQHLNHIGNSQGKSGKVFGFLFKKKQNPVDLKQRFSGEGDLVYVDLNNFAIEIGQRMYDQIEKKVKLLYINSTQTFRFEEQKYTYKPLARNKKLFIPQPETQGEKRVLMRTISKLSDESNITITSYLKGYKNAEYKEQLVYALEKVHHYEIYTTMTEQEKTCEQLLAQHEYLSQKDLKSIFFKLIQMIESVQAPLCSISPENIIMGKKGITISEIFSLLTFRVEIDYFAPEEFLAETFGKWEIQMINLWKAGILLFELAYGNVPFSAEQLVSQITKGQNIELIFPIYSLRTQQFQKFIQSILRIDPKERGKGTVNSENDPCNKEWKENLMKLSWLKYK